MESHPGHAWLLAVRLLNGDGVAIYETRTYALVNMLARGDCSFNLASAGNERWQA
jgi:hypothetical protein